MNLVNIITRSVKTVKQNVLLSNGSFGLAVQRIGRHRDSEASLVLEHQGWTSLHTPEGRLTRQSLPGPLEVNVGLDFHRRSRRGNADEGQIEGHARWAGSGDRDIERARGHLAR